MCNPVAQFGYSALTSVGDYMAQRQATTAANRARLLNFREDNKKYYRDVILNNVRWKNGLLDSDIAYANLFQQASESWRQQDLAVQQAESQHAENTIQALTELARKEYAGTQTGVTASRLANEGPRQVGFALTKSMRQLMMTKDTASLNKEITAADANRRRRKIFQDSWRSPVHGHTPLAPVLESGPSLGLLVAKLGVAALGTVGKDWFKGKGDKNIGFKKGTDHWNATGGTDFGANAFKNVPDWSGSVEKFNTNIDLDFSKYNPNYNLNLFSDKI